MNVVEHWAGANCAGLSLKQADMLFFTPSRYEAGKQVCAGCPWITECRKLGDAFSVGVFGGTTPAERTPEPPEAPQQALTAPYSHVPSEGRYVGGCRCRGCCEAHTVGKRERAARKRANGNEPLKRLVSNLPQRPAA